MRQYKLFFCLVASQILLCVSVWQPQQNTQQKHDHFYTYLASFHYPPAFCKQHICHKRRSDFLMLMISMSENTHQYSEIPNSYLEERQTRLEKWWPDLCAEDFEESKDFWKVTYKTHGASKYKNFNPKEYIELGLSIGEEYGKAIMTYLSTHGIFPNGEQYTPREIGEAIKTETNRYPAITCFSHNNDHYLARIGLCFNNERVMGHCFKGQPNYCQGIDKVYFLEP